MQVERVRLSGSVGLVPTMGALHDGHLSLVRRAWRDSDHVVVSAFVNPTQFGPQEDYRRYPRDREGDLRLLSDAGVDVAFVPSVDEIYPPGFDEWVEVQGPPVTRLEGAARPGHFRGVTTVVARLFRIVQPQRAYFGQKDAQQLAVIRKLVRDLDIPVAVVGVPTVREPDGLALSSRNVHLKGADRERALALHRALSAAQEIARNGERDADTVKSAAVAAMQPYGIEPEYLELVEPHSFVPVSQIDGDVLVAVAARVGDTRLIDNTLISKNGSSS